ncbi:adenylate/guanylate cyclase domain-containing protein [PVC group bacterium]|nr:adenylate/guanylate cyclase domain-containing protein [PVC group bacterium]
MSENTKLQKYISGKFLSFIIILSLTWGLQTTTFFRDFESDITDFFFNLRGAIKENPNITIIEIGETELEILGRDLSQYRFHHAQLLDALQYYGAKTVVFDMLFYESVDFTIEDELTSEDVYIDDLFADAVRRTNFVYLGTETLKDSDGYPTGYRPIIPPLMDAVRGIGDISYIADEKGIVRKIEPLQKAGDKKYFHLALLGISHYLGINPKNDIDIIDGKLVINTPQGNPITVPLDKDKYFYVNWSGPWTETFHHLSYLSLLSSYQSDLEGLPVSIHPDDLEKLKGSICILGGTAIGLYDTKATPFDSIYPMVGIHANIMSNILNQDFLKRPPLWINFLVVLFFIIAIYLVTPLLSIARGFGFFVIWNALFLYTAYVFFSRFGIGLDVYQPLQAGFITYITITLYQYFFEQKDKRLVKGVLQKYISRQVMETVLKHPDKLKLGGDKKDLTMAFCDIRGFTAFSENHTPEDVVDLLNYYLSTMSNKILDYGGTVDKFIGDCIMFFFGAPVDQPQHAELAVSAAIDIQRAMTQLNRSRRKKNQATIHVGIGINSGDVIIGHIGTTDRMDYTVIGDNVNLAARLEAVAKKGQIIISNSTYQLVKDKITATALEPVQVKGKKRLIDIYEVVY